MKKKNEQQVSGETVKIFPSFVRIYSKNNTNISWDYKRVRIYNWYRNILGLSANYMNYITFFSLHIWYIIHHRLSATYIGISYSELLMHLCSNTTYTETLFFFLTVASSVFDLYTSSFTLRILGTRKNKTHW